MRFRLTKILSMDFSDESNDFGTVASIDPSNLKILARQHWVVMLAFIEPFPAPRRAMQRAEANGIILCNVFQKWRWAVYI